MTYVNFKLDTDANGIALITWDAPGRSMNVIDLNVIEELSDIVETVAGDRAIRGAVITSGKEAFCAGADLAMLETSIHTFAEMARARGMRGREGWSSGQSAMTTPQATDPAGGASRPWRSARVSAWPTSTG